MNFREKRERASLQGTQAAGDGVQGAVLEEADCLRNESDAGGPEARRPRQKPEMGPAG